MTTDGISLHKVPELWFEDGNVIIISGDRAYRVYQGIIASRSPVLRDIFNTTSRSSLPMNTVTSPTLSMQDGADRIVVDGAKQIYTSLGVTECPIVRMTDKPRHVKWFLSAFLGNSRQYSSNLVALAGILRLAMKYKADSLQRWAVSCLERLLPIEQDIVIEDTRKKDTTEWMNGLLSVIDVAITADVLWILPKAYYLLWQTSLAQIVKHPEWKELSDERRTNFLLGWEAAQTVDISDVAHALRVHRWMLTAFTTKEHSTCSNQFKEVLIGVVLKDGHRSGNDNAEANASAWEIHWNGHACHYCRMQAKAQRLEMMAEAVATIRNHFGLPHSKQLDEMRIKYHQADHL